MYEQRLGHIPPSSYWRDDVLNEEMARIFKPSWLCVAFTDDLSSDRDFVTCEIAGHSIVVQNFKGVLKAFRNVCSHRFSRIQTEPCGNRPLTCPYHGWSYDAEGRPHGIPQNAAAFGLSEEDRTALALSAYELEVCGRFVFVRMQPGGPGLRDFLGRIYDDLVHFTEVCPKQISRTTLEWEVNWKIGMENAAEGYHTRMIHRDSLDPTLQDDLLVETIEDHTVFYRSLTQKTQKWWDHVARVVHMQVSDRFPKSVNWVIFPNIVILATHGASFVFQTFEPVSALRFRFKSTYWMADSRSGAATDIIARNLAEFSERVMGEDHGVCTLVQAGVQDVPTERPPLLGEPEGRIAHFQKAYARRMEVVI
ncbi:aromatic ring-hydroxylating oxygenase subunit alpha [Asticcacaulis benevestitus]|uniref:Rieske domain-containing protein n=1 Tax=Asticcacaulis benevestitus DSM 16100 = ATCC BAA-896 TaxID=1121022 RepID=V4PHM8_9CAUL|nr:aromatic ring-hydroxylating dioxygenase subunit alpha [Asticcacaulis benevestitus]ESQ93452.1 hypothetical protein ABENE_05985 [Asticcacaulis benevestitus DSM 16100 = ATCC BAA-896]